MQRIRPGRIFRNYVFQPMICSTTECMGRMEKRNLVIGDQGMPIDYLEEKTTGTNRRDV